jgi:hypothetical protein
MAAVCIGPGLTTDSQGRLTVEQAPWQYPCEGSRGEPVIVDASGNLRSGPRQQVLNTFYSENTPGFIWTPPNGIAGNICNLFAVDVTNPDPCRRMRGVAFWTLRVVANIATHAALQVSGAGDAAHTYRNDTDEDFITIFHDFMRTGPIEIPPSGTYGVGMQLCSTRTEGAATATNVTEMRAALRIMAVSETPS